ncbi:GlsB/YeaQ/YmgE family stress response membrane protein [Bacillus mojavensis]|nr:GlsB/YeaQ/YmgE family stress response membrane protein [Bacillus mojavensis]
MSFIISLIVAIIIGWVGSLFVKGDMPGGIIGSMIAGLIGAWIGHGLLGTWGPHLAGFAIIPAIIGSVIVVFLVSLLARKRG